MTLPLPHYEPELSLSTLRHLMAEEKRTNEELHKLAKRLLRQGVKIKYRIGYVDYQGEVIGVVGVVGRTELLVRNLATLKKRIIRLIDITEIER